MARYRDYLPQLGDTLFLTDGGLETAMIFNKGFDLPEFAAFTLLENGEGRRALREYFGSCLELARKYKVGFVLEGPTWRANTDWGAKLGYSEVDLASRNREAIKILSELRDEYETIELPVVISGCMGPRGDGYNIEQLMSIEEAQQYHLPQINTFIETAADMVSAFTMTYVEEAAGLALAARSLDMPVVISFTVETDGRLPNGQLLARAIEEVDEVTQAAPAYYMINCAHPTHFANVLGDGGVWLERIRGVRANASSKSHAELDQSEELDQGSPAELGRQYLELCQQLKNLRVLGGCCGTDQRHLEEICKTCL